MSEGIIKAGVVVLWVLFGPREGHVFDTVDLPACVGDQLSAEELEKYTGTWDLLDPDGEPEDGGRMRITVGQGSTVEELSLPSPPPRNVISMGRKSRKEVNKEVPPSDPPQQGDPAPEIYNFRQIGKLIVGYYKFPPDPKQPERPDCYTPFRVELQDANLMRIFLPTSGAWRIQIDAGRLAGQVLADKWDDDAQVSITSTPEQLAPVLTEEFLNGAFEDKAFFEDRRVQEGRPKAPFAPAGPNQK